jgi:hypothetical protein
MPAPPPQAPPPPAPSGLARWWSSAGEPQEAPETSARRPSRAAEPDSPHRPHAAAQLEGARVRQPPTANLRPAPKAGLEAPRLGNQPRCFAS